MIVNTAELLLELGLAEKVTDAQLAMVARMQGPVEAAIKKYLHIDIEQATYTEFLPRQNNNAPIYPGGIGGYDVIGNKAFPWSYSSSDRLQLKQSPVRSVLSVYEDPTAYGGQADGSFPESSLLLPGKDYYLDIDDSGFSTSGQLIRIGVWSGMPRSIKVTYVAGYTPAELAGDPAQPVNASHFRQAVLEEFADRYANALARWKQIGSEGRVMTGETLGDYQAQFAATPNTRPGICQAAMDQLGSDFNWAFVA